MRAIDPEIRKARAREYQRLWRLGNPEKRREQAKRWRRKFPERHRAQRARWREKNVFTAWTYLIWNNHRMEPLEYYLLLASQHGVCAICGRKERKLHALTNGPMRLSVDHDHSCCPNSKSCGKCTRGLLCTDCNRALGMFSDSPAILRNAAVYTESFQ